MLIDNGEEILFGSRDMFTKAYSVFDDRVCSFLNCLSEVLRKSKEAQPFPEIKTLAFWIRKANIEKLKRVFHKESEAIHYGRGLVFHISPSNIPINFAYSWVYGLLSGNSNIIKVSSKRFRQTDIICAAAEKVISDNKEFMFIKESNAVVLYERDRNDITERYLSCCDARVIWGGDDTVQKMRTFPSKPRCIEIAFADRYSFTVIDAETVVQISNEDLHLLARRFYNDTYLVDQNACSSPQIIFWIGKDSSVAEERFFNTLFQQKKNYNLSEEIVCDKYEHMCEMVIDHSVESVKCYGNFIYVYHMSRIEPPIEKYRGKCGEFFSYTLRNIDDLAEFLNDVKIQTCSTYGIDKQKLLDMITREGIRGVDRIVDIGQALNLDVIWDGYDVIGMLSRCITL